MPTIRINYLLQVIIEYIPKRYDSSYAQKSIRYYLLKINVTYYEIIFPLQNLSVSNKEHFSFEMRNSFRDFHTSITQYVLPPRRLLPPVMDAHT